MSGISVHGARIRAPHGVWDVLERPRELPPSLVTRDGGWIVKARVVEKHHESTGDPGTVVELRLDAPTLLAWEMAGRVLADQPPTTP